MMWINMIMLVYHWLIFFRGFFVWILFPVSLNSPIPATVSTLCRSYFVYFNKKKNVRKLYEKMSFLFLFCCVSPNSIITAGSYVPALHLTNVPAAANIRAFFFCVGNFEWIFCKTRTPACIDVFENKSRSERRERKRKSNK